MSDASTKKMISAYIERSAQPQGFLSGFFQTPPENFHATEEVEIDIQRNGEDVAIVVQDLSTKGRENESTVYTNKRFKPPIYDERFSLNSFNLLKRSPGDNPFNDVNFMASAAREFMSGMRRIEEKIRRAIELQASQVLQTGTLSLVDSAGTALYTLDYSPKSAHFPTASNAWGGGSATVLSDIESLCDVISLDGKAEPNRIIMGRAALKAFLADTKVQVQLNNWRMDVGSIGRPQVQGAGGKFHGWISVGQYSLEIWSYSGWYKHPQTGVATRYITPDKAIIMSDGRLDLTFGAVPSIVGPDPRLAGINLGRVRNGDGGMDLFTNLWISEDGRNLHGSVAARPLCIPTAIDTFGCIDTNAS